MFFQSLQTVIDQLLGTWEAIPQARLTALRQLRTYLHEHRQQPLPITFICTHNSRRSQLAQVWAQIAAWYFDWPHIRTFSGGTEVTACHPNTIAAMVRCDMHVEKLKSGTNPTYHIEVGPDKSIVPIFSKHYADPHNPQENYVAVMTCGHADENCPVVTGAAYKTAITYVDPKSADHTPNQVQAYDDCCRAIARDCLFLFAPREKHQ